MVKRGNFQGGLFRFGKSKSPPRRQPRDRDGAPSPMEMNGKAGPAPRFISEDPKGFDAGVNFYAYVKNNSPNFNDPSGKQSPAYSRFCIGKGGGWANPICGYCQYICYLDYPIWAGPIEIQPLSFLNVSIGTIQKACPSNGGKCPYALFLEGGSPWSMVSRDWKITKCQQYRQ